MLDKDKRINELLADKEFFKKITSMKTIEEVIGAFKEEGIEISVEEVQEIESMINEVVAKLNGEALENVSGGKKVLRPGAEKFLNFIGPGSKTMQFGQGLASGGFGPVWAYGHMGNLIYDEPKTKGEKAARYAGIAIGAAETVFTGGLTWLFGSGIDLGMRAMFKDDDKDNKDS